MIVDLEAIHVKEAAALHLKYLKTYFKGTSGKKIIECVYKVVASNSGGKGFIAIDNDNIIGFICGIWNQKAIYRKILKDNGIWLFLLVLWQSFANPKCLIYIIKLIYSIIFEKEKKIKSYELRPIVVSPDCRGKGVAVALVDVLKEDAAKRGFKNIYLYVELENIRAKKFYEKIGFRQKDRIKKMGVLYYIYILDI